MSEQPVPRDPRVEPRAGDVVRPNGGPAHTVVRVTTGSVRATYGDGPPYKYELTRWRKLMLTATIIHVAEG